MKKFTKLFLSCAAMAAVTAAVATSAMAADPTISVTYEQANQNGELTLTVNGVTGEATLLVTKKDIEKDTIADADILYIDQETATDAGAAEFGTDGKVGLRKQGTSTTQYLEDGVYNVYVGYTDDTFKVAKQTFTVGNVGTEYMLGNVDLSNDSNVTSGDAVLILKQASGQHTLDDNPIKMTLGNVDYSADSNLTSGDAVLVLKKSVNQQGIEHVGDMVMVDSEGNIIK